ncbi:maltase 1-like [Trichogramma pretiosum]|uniref:maltase 1-like n=1 Tax=Trichogramma pretiosum TaxID=7493 RepID=UPI0006C98FF9|nr:maltase 1-like [Trichogramma pretiosum]
MWKTLLLCQLLLVVASGNRRGRLAGAKWWEHAIVYQVYPRSFRDSDGDGVGDLRGVIEGLDHVRSVADCLWLSPIYPSPQRDFGYDVSNFKAVEPQYGSIEDLDELVRKAKSLGLKVILDFVPNHSSDEHDWFKRSARREEPYAEFYVWRDARYSAEGERLPPNNWLSGFGGSAWTWNEERGQYYYHAFSEHQPDLNYRSPRVQLEMMLVLKFWLDHGVDGFRVDAVNALFEDTQFRDEPPSSSANGSLVEAGDDYPSLSHIYTRDLDETYNVVRSWKTMMNHYTKKLKSSQKLALMEVFAKLPKVIKYYHVGAEPMNLRMIHQLRNDSRPEEFKALIEDWMRAKPKHRAANWVVGNHDIGRTASRFGYDNDRADEMSMLAAVLPGMMIVYQGDEIGMTDARLTYEQTRDPVGCAAGPEGYAKTSRDPQRTPYQWDDTTSAGFSSNATTWLPVNDNYRDLNLRQQTDYFGGASHYKVFRALAKLKRHRTVQQGALRVKVIEDGQVLVVVRELRDEVPTLLLISFADRELRVDALSKLDVPAEMRIYVASVKSRLRHRERVDMSRVRLPARASVIFAADRLRS